MLFNWTIWLSHSKSTVDILQQNYGMETSRYIEKWNDDDDDNDDDCLVFNCIFFIPFPSGDT